MDELGPELAVIEKALELVDDDPDVALHMVKETQTVIDMGIDKVLWSMWRNNEFHPWEIKGYLNDMKSERTKCQNQL